MPNLSRAEKERKLSMLRLDLQREQAANSSLQVRIKNINKGIAELENDLRGPIRSYEKVQTDPITDGIESLGLQGLVITLLRNAHIMTVGDLIQLSKAEILSVPGFSRPLLVEVLNALKRHNLPEPKESNL